MKPFVLWVGKAKDRKPPVLFKLSFRNAEGYSALFQTSVDELDDGFKLSGAIADFYERYHNKLPYSLTNTYPLYHGEKTKSIYFPPLANIERSRKLFEARISALFYFLIFSFPPNSEIFFNFFQIDY